MGRYEILRTTYTQVDDLLVQVVHASGEPSFDVVDNARGSWSDALRAARDLANQPFDLTRAPTLRARLIRLGDDSCLFVMSAPHIAMDGWSIDTVLGELGQLFAGDSGLTGPALQFGDFAVWDSRRPPDQGDRSTGSLSWRELRARRPLRSRARDADRRPAGRRIRRRAPAGGGHRDVGSGPISPGRLPFMVLAATVSTFFPGTVPAPTSSSAHR